MAKQIGGRIDFDFPYVVTYLVVAVLYIATCVALSRLARRLEGRARRSPAVRTPAAQGAAPA
ncbi:hypothetical protein GCM10025868_07190 [Angustibacter aerolatus]|uniref:Amino acid ABC transporter permease n=1 Tax=Angustibacter aerolatus TaxID=1162965 RepID=A0ABQ6JCF1_9ACTN|nr:hypothetical protein [Angustibacter aerolatus]GMA85469.1 hypothetical protein GCM10025868_07190 [Angustibacter aerolatus]